MYRRYGKRLTDLLLSAAGLILLSPLLALLASVWWYSYRESPFFIQERIGHNHRTFRILKLKTMRTRTDVRGNSLPDAERITGLGRFLRAVSLDELPQLWNVLKGEMSLVGPRPLLTAYLPLYNRHERRRHEVLPGITGWAQVNGRDRITWQEQFGYDVWYVDNLSFPLDLKIMWKTFLGKGTGEKSRAVGRKRFEGTIG